MADLTTDMGLSRVYPEGYPVTYPVSHRVEGGLSRQSAPYVVGLWRDSTTPRALAYPKGLSLGYLAELVGGGQRGIR